MITIMALPTTRRDPELAEDELRALLQGLLHPGRALLPQHLPREERRHVLAEGERMCECCQQPKQRNREEVAERLDYIPSRFIVIRDVTEVYGCSCGFSKPAAAVQPSRVIDGGLPEPGLLAHVVILKYEDHQPINRQSKIFAREGVTLSPNTLME